MRTAGTCRAIEPLERRRILSAAVSALASPLDSPAASYVPPGAFVFDRNSFLTQPATGDALDIGLGYVRANSSRFGIEPPDVGSPFVTSRYTDATSGITHIYLRQELNGLEVANADMNVNVTRDGRILSIGCRFVPGLGSRPGPQPIAARLSSSQALSLALANLDVTGMALGSIPSRLHYVASPRGAELAWNFQIRTPDGTHWYDTNVSADDGSMRFTADWTHNLTDYS
ncbi:MAG: hypothetical protein ACREJC_08875, partial [Tepidisphaeraceae bacterium]